jgi:hypothetical protein
MDPALVGAIFTGVAGVIGAIGVVVKIVLTRPRLPVAEEILEQLDEVRTEMLVLAAWAHDAMVAAAAAGIELPEPPDSLRVLGRRSGERRNGDHGWRSSVRVQTGDQPVARDVTAPMRPGMGPDTNPERRRPPPPRG